MKNICIKKVKKDIWCIMLLSVLFTTDTIFFGTNENLFWPKLVQSSLLFVALLLVMYFIKVKRRIELKKIIVLMLMSLLILLTGISNEDIRFGYIFKIGLFTYALAVIEYVSLEKFAMYFDNIIYFFSVVSLIGYIVVGVFPEILNFAIPLKNNAGVEYYNFIFFVVEKGQSYLRNYSVFREPGVFQAYIIIALIFQMSFSSIFQKKRMIVYIITIITTFSTTGYIALVFVMILFIIKKPSLINNKRLLISVIISTIGVAFFLLVMLPNSSLLLSPVYAKFSKSNSSYVSFLARKASIVVNIHLWAENPICGVGLTDVDKLFPIISQQLLGSSVSSNTNTFLAQFASHGFVYGIIWAIGFFKGACSLGKTINEKLLLITIVIVLSVGQNFTFSPLVNILLWYGLFENKNALNL